MRAALRLPLPVRRVQGMDDQSQHASVPGAYILLFCYMRTEEYALQMLHRNETETTDSTHSDAFVPDREWWERLFSSVDAGDAAGFMNFLTPDATFRFGNAPLVVGAESIGAAVAGFFAAIAGSRHRLLGTWNGAASTVCEGEVAYTRHDGSVISFPFVNVFELRGKKIAAYRIYIDNSPLFAARV